MVYGPNCVPCGKGINAESITRNYRESWVIRGSRGEITGLGLTSTGEIHTYLATPTQGVASGESTSQGAISRL